MPNLKPAPRAKVGKTGSADAVDGSVAVSGNVIGDINLFTGAPVRTRYREQVLRIGPPILDGRDKELAELSEFCTARESDHSYIWWRGEAWAGKSALMAWFVLNPPARIRIVSFFVTSRFASQDDRGAFIENVLEQLATLLDEPMPAYLTDSTRDAHLLGMLSDAAHACEERGERLVLVVDGLDEDRGVTTGPSAYSIAALLPKTPPAGMRVVVAGRPNPPIPIDVPQHHPLRDPSIVRLLSPSPYAAVVRNDMEGELKRLLLGSQSEQDLLGLVTAARGGLSASDLAELTARPSWQISDDLQGVAGRSFRTRPSRWLPGVRPDIYVLGHEDLQATAKEFLGEAKLLAYRKQLRSWADGYRERNWPEETPEYLLRGYYQMLKEAGDLNEMIACATDRLRQDRMLDISGGDSAALDEISAAQEVIVTSSSPDLDGMARLAVFRDYLTERNTAVPVELPAAWASLGQVKRAEALARSILDPQRRDSSLVEMVKAVSAAGDLQKADLLAQLITAGSHRSEATTALVKAAATVGDFRWAEALLHTIPYRGERTLGLITLAQAAATAGDLMQAENLIDKAREGLTSIGNTRRQGEALAAYAQALAVVGDLTQARVLIGKVRALVPSIAKAGWQAAVWAALIRAVAEVEGQEFARRVIGEAREFALSLADLSSRAGALASVARAAEAVGDLVQAQTLMGEVEVLVRAIEKPAPRAAAWAMLLRTAGTVNVERAQRLAHEAEAVTQSLADRTARAKALAVLARAVNAVGAADLARRLADQAESLTRSTGDPERRARDLAVLAKVFASTGNVRKAEEVANLIPGGQPRSRVEALISVAKAAAAAGDLEHALAIAHSMVNAGQQAGALAAVAKELISIGDTDQAEEVARSIAISSPRDEVLMALAKRLATVGAMHKAEALVSSIESSSKRSSALGSLAETAAASNDLARATVLAQQAEASAKVGKGEQRSAALVGVVKAMAASGNLRSARQIARSISSSSLQGTARLYIVKYIAATGNVNKANSAALAIQDRYWRAMAQVAIVEQLALEDSERACRFAKKIVAQARDISNLGQRDSVLASLARAVAVGNNLNYAEGLIAKVDSPARQAQALIAASEIVEPSEKPRLIAKALQLDHWTTSLAALVRVRPAILAVIADDVAATAAE